MATARNYYVDKKEILELKYKMSEYEDKETELDPFGFDGGEPDSFYDGMRQYNDHVSSIIKRLKTELVENYTTDGETCDPEAGEKYFTELKENVPTLVNGSLVQSLTPNEWQSLVKEIGRYAWKVAEKNLRMRDKVSREEKRLGFTRYEEYTPDEFIKTYNPSLVDGKICIKKPGLARHALKQYVDRHRTEIENLLKKTKEEFDNAEN